MPCAAFEDRLLDYADLAAAEREVVDVHTANCADCREYLETLTSLDTHLSNQLIRVLAESKPSLDMAATTLARVRAPRPTALPELLDFVGWSAVVGILSALAWWWREPVTFTDAILQYALYGSALVAMAAGLWIGFRSWVELRD
jgi:anti-sigma factor RsiW